METTNNDPAQELTHHLRDLFATAGRAEALIRRITENSDGTIQAISKHTAMKTVPIINAAERAAEKLEQTLKQYAQQRLVLATLETDLMAAIEQLRKVRTAGKAKPPTQDEHR